MGEQPVDDLLAPGTDPERLVVGPWNVPELTDDRIGPGLLHQPRQQGEVVILHENDGAVVADLVDDGVGEPLIDALVLAANRADRTPGARRRCGRAATERCWRARSSSPPPPRGQPDAAKRVGRVVWRHLHPALRVGNLPVAAPLPCAIHVPPHARITGSSAVTRPLAGRIQVRLACSPRPETRRARHVAEGRRSASRMCGSRLATTISFVLLRRGPSAAMSSDAVVNTCGHFLAVSHLRRVSTSAMPSS